MSDVRHYKQRVKATQLQEPKPPTSKEVDTLCVIHALEELGKKPTLREISSMIGISQTACDERIRRCRAKGLVREGATALTPRGIEIAKATTTLEAAAARAKTGEVPDADLPDAGNDDMSRFSSSVAGGI